MPKVRLNTALTGLSGTIDGLVFRTFQHGATHVRRPARRRARTSADQRQTIGTFSGGDAYARTLTPEVRQRYNVAAVKLWRANRRQKAKLNYRQMAIRDFFHGPTIQDFDHSGYARTSGGELQVAAKDDFEVARVCIVLRAADGAVLSWGDATQGNYLWRFTVPPPAADAPPAASVTVTAFDRPGNFAIGTFPLG